MLKLDSRQQDAEKDRFAALRIVFPKPPLTKVQNLSQPKEETNTQAKKGISNKRSK